MLGSGDGMFVTDFSLFFAGLAAIQEGIFLENCQLIGS